MRLRLARPLLWCRSMRNTDSIPSLDVAELTTVTGGCGKKQAPPPQAPPPQMAPPPERGGVDVTVATGARAAQLIGQAQGGAAPRMI
jgi:hypothetical protein